MHISIHALREEGDPGRSGCNGDIKISIHALREEGDPANTPLNSLPMQFLSTPSARRATRLRQASKRTAFYFYPRPPRGGRLSSFSFATTSGDFYPRPPRGGRRGCAFSGHRSGTISIHALREEGDILSFSGTGSLSYFYPRPPRGGRRSRRRNR